MPDFPAPPTTVPAASMPRWLGVAALLLLLAGCGPNPGGTAARQETAAAPAGAAAATLAVSRGGHEKLAYSHELKLEMPAASVQPRYERTRNLCAGDAEPGCIILEAGLDTGRTDDDDDGPSPRAWLTVRLPHAAVAAFEASLLAPLAREKPGDVALLSHRTTAEDLTKAIADTGQRQKQLLDYRDRMTALAHRKDAQVADLVTIEGELSKVQSELETIAGEQKGLDERVATERLEVEFRSKFRPGSDFRSVVRTWREASDMLNQSTADALRFAIGSLPWLPILGAGLVFVRLILRRWRR